MPKQLKTIQDLLLRSGNPQHGSGECGGRVLHAHVCMWLLFVEHQSLHPEGGETSTAEPESKEDLAAGRGSLVAITVFPAAMFKVGTGEHLTCFGSWFSHGQSGPQVVG